jgi:hypothetical protein
MTPRAKLYVGSRTNTSRVTVGCFCLTGRRDSHMPGENAVSRIESARHRVGGFSKCWISDPCNTKRRFRA